MERAAAVAAVLVCLGLLAIGRLLARARRRRRLHIGAVSQQWLSEHIDHVRD